MRSPRICFYGNFGAGNLGNEATLQAVIEQIVRRWPDGRLLCFCTDPQDVRARHHIAALPAQAVNGAAAERSGAGARRGSLAGGSVLLSSGFLSNWFTGSSACKRSAAQICSLSPGPELFATT